MITKTRKCIDQLARYGRKPRNAEIGQRIDFAEDSLLSALREIQSRLTVLLADFEGDRQYEAVSAIAGGAGAAGPIGSQWEKAVAKAVELESLCLYGCERTDIPE